MIGCVSGWVSGSSLMGVGEWVSVVAVGVSYSGSEFVLPTVVPRE